MRDRDEVPTAPDSPGPLQYTRPTRPGLTELIQVDEESRLEAPFERVGSWQTPVQSPRPVHPARRLLRRLVRVGLALFLIQILVFNFSVVRGSSMLPGIQDGDRILVDQVSYLFSSVERGDVVVLRYPLDPSLDYIKRVVGVPGDEIHLARGRVWVNGRMLDEPYAFPAARELDHFTRVRPGHYFVLGDNRPHSSDSREFGQVAEQLVRGRVNLRVWPPARAGRID